MLILVSTQKTVSEVASSLKTAIEANHFRIKQFYNIKEIMLKKGEGFSRECQIFEVCQSQQDKTISDQNLSILTVLRCRISVYEAHGKTIIAALRPTKLLAIFRESFLEKAAEEVENTMVKIMNEAV